MSRTIPERYRWAVEILDVRADDEILEVGCGCGHSIPLICEKLEGGHLTAIDRSEEMIAVAARSASEFVASGKVSVLHKDLLDGDLPVSHFDKVFLFNLNVFWMDPVAELAEIRLLLKPCGRFFLFHQPPPGHDLKEFETAFRLNLMKYNYSLVDHFKDPKEAVRSVAMISTPNRR